MITIAKEVRRCLWWPKRGQWSGDFFAKEVKWNSYDSVDLCGVNPVALLNYLETVKQLARRDF